MHRLSMALGKSALVTRSCEINTQGPCYVRISGRKSGIMAFILTHLGVDTSETLEVYRTKMKYSAGSLSGQINEVIPLSQISNLGMGYLKPVIWLALAIVFVVLALPTIGITLIPAAICLYLFYYRKTLMIYAIPNSSFMMLMLFKRSFIENVSIDEETADKIIQIISQLVDMETKK